MRFVALFLRKHSFALTTEFRTLGRKKYGLQKLIYLVFIFSDSPSFVKAKLYFP